MLLAGTTNSVGSATFPEWLPPLIIIPVMVLIVLMIRKSRKRAKANKEAIRQSGILSSIFTLTACLDNRTYVCYNFCIATIERAAT